MSKSSRLTVLCAVLLLCATAAFGASPVAFGGRPGPSRETGIQLIIGR